MYMYDQVHMFPFDKVPPGSEIIIYGAGVVGHEYFLEVTALAYCGIKAIVDANRATLFQSKIAAASPKVLETASYDYVVIAAHDSMVADDIRSVLLGLGVAHGKIVRNDQGNLAKAELLPELALATKKD